MRKSSVMHLLPICVMLAIGCDNWEWRRADLTPQSLNDKDTAIVWSHQTSLALAHVTITRDSITGIRASVLADRRESLPLSEVDSIGQYELSLGSIIARTATTIAALGILAWSLWEDRCTKGQCPHV